MGGSYKKALGVLLLIGSIQLPARAVDGKSLVMGIGIGLGLYYKPVANHTIKPLGRKLQKLVRPMPQDKVEAEQKKEAKRRAKKEKN